jgi:sugar lactone lactonase YvrE
MTRPITIYIAITMLLLSPFLVAWDRGRATTFATLPEGSAHPEGMTTDAKGNFYVVTWDYDHLDHLGHLIIFAPDGKYQRRVEIAGSSSRLGDVSFQPDTGNLLVVDYGGKRVLKVDPMTGASSLFITIPGEKAAPNGMIFDKKGNIYLTDSLQGTVWRTGPAGGTASPWLKHDLLLSHGGISPLGANGLTFDRTESAMFIGNTGDCTIIKVPVLNGEAGEPAVIVASVFGPDGMFVDEQDRLWVVENRNDDVVVFDATGRAIAKFGDFDGLDQRGTTRGLLFPAEMLKIGDDLYVGNLVVDVRALKRPQSPISQYAAQVKHYTIVRMKARIPTAAH